MANANLKEGATRIRIVPPDMFADLVHAVAEIYDRAGVVHSGRLLRLLRWANGLVPTEAQPADSERGGV